MKSLVYLGIILFLSCNSTKSVDKKCCNNKNTDTKETVMGNNEFALDLYKVAKSNENFICSPYSVTTALAMTYAGAKGETQKEMAKVLHFSDNKEKLHSDLSTLTKELINNDNFLTINIANSIWSQKGLKLQKDFTNTTKKYYKSNHNIVDFVGNIEQSRSQINNWVSENTNNRIEELLSKDDISQSTSLVLTNAIYFWGEWKHSFNKKETRSDIFFDNNDVKIKTSFMKTKGLELKYYKDNEFQMLELPYKGDNKSMMIIMPNENNISIIEDRLSIKEYTKWCSILKPTKLDIEIPKFDFETKIKMKETLSNMGMPMAFKSSADFTGITKDQRLFIDNVIHQANITVNEEGTEAAAATAVIMRKSASINQKFVANHPFIFIIKDNQTNSILFIGKVCDPTAK